MIKKILPVAWGVLCFSFCKTLLMLELRINSPCLHLQRHAHYYDYGTAASFRNLYNSEFFFFFGMPENTLWQGINFQLLSHPSYWMKVTVSICKMTLLSSLSSLLYSHPPHQGMSQRIWHLGGEGGERQEEIERGGEEQRWGRPERWVDQYLRETWEDVAWPFLSPSLKRRHKKQSR